MRTARVPALALVAALAALLPSGAASRPPAPPPGQGLVIELDNAFIDAYRDRATIETEFKIADLSAVHKPASDGEVHVGGWSYEAGLAGVAEVMNAANLGKKPRLALLAAKNAGQKVTVTGAWRLWGEHGGTAPQLQAKGTDPHFPLPGEYPSNPDHVFEVHPVTKVKVGNKVTDATDAVGETPGFTPHDAQKAFVQGYELLPCKIIPKNGRTRIVTKSLGFNFTEFIFRLGEAPVALTDPAGKPDGHGVIGSVFDTDGELLVRNRRVVFLPGTAADEEVKGMKEGGRLRVTGIPRISLKLVHWRLEHKDSTEYDTPPLEWHLPYEMIIVAADKLDGDGD